MSLPLRVSAATLLSNLNPQVELDLHIVHHGWNDRDFERRRARLDGVDRSYRLSLYKGDTTPYHHFKSLHGSFVPYLLLDIPELVRAERILYVDADTLPVLDVTSVVNRDLHGHSIGAVGWNMDAQNALEQEFFREIGISADTPVFNTGVVVVDSARWRMDHVRERCMELGKRRGRQLLAADQTVLNGVLRGDFCALPWRYNVRLGPSAELFSGSGILHFVGTPKPWQLQGRFRHRNYKQWARHALRVGERTQQLFFTLA